MDHPHAVIVEKNSITTAFAPTQLIRWQPVPEAANMPGLLERLRGPGISGAVAPIGASARNLLVRYLAFLETIVLCLSVPIRGYDDPNFDIPSATRSLHLQSCEIVSASVW